MTLFVCIYMLYDNLFCRTPLIYLCSINHIFKLFQTGIQRARHWPPRLCFPGFNQDGPDFTLDRSSPVTGCHLWPDWDCTSGVIGVAPGACVIYFREMSTGERPFTDILTSLRYWVIHSVTIPALFLSGWIFVATGIASELLTG